MNEKTGCGCYLWLIVINFIFGGMCVDYILSWFAKDIPFIWDVVIGLFLGELAIPLAIVGAILRAFGVF